MTDHDPLSDVLAQWQPEPTVAPDFAAGVHQRLNESAPPSLAARIIHFPAALPLAAGFAIVLGVTTALSANRADAQAQNAEAYARSIDPVWMTTPLHP